MTSGSGTTPLTAAHKRTASSLSSSASAAAHRLHHHPVRSPSDRHSSLSKSQSPSPERQRKRANSSRTALNGHAASNSSSRPSNGGGHGGDSEAETDILSDEEPSKSKVKKRVVKNEPKDDGDSSAASLKTTKSESARSHTVSRASSVHGDASHKTERKPNGVEGCENGHGKAILKDKPRLSNEFSKNSSRAQSADATTSPNEHNDRSRQAHSAEPRKRKFSDAQKPSKLEPPRQKPRLDEASKASKPQKRPSSPPTPGTPGLRSSHRRSASTQSNLPSAGLGSTRARRDISSTSLPPTAKEWATSDMSSDEAATYPPIPMLAPPPRSGRAAYRAMTSPARTAPTGKRADKFGSTPLARACEKGNFKAVKQAYEEAPGEIDQADNGGFAPLQKAALEGHAEIVKFLLDKGCRRDVCSKDEQDTPLIDAVENGHLDVVKLLLDNGVNPHHQNKSGKRAIDAIDEEEDYASDMREMLQNSMQNYVGSDSDSDDDNQDFPLIRPEDKNRSDLLYLEPNRANLLEYSRKGDVVAVDHFLSSVKPDNASAVVAARAGHHLVLNLLLASAGQQLEKDPDPTKYDETPLLAAIGRGHLKVIKLLLGQDNFNPARRTKEGQLYYEVAEERRGPRWQTETALLKEHYDAYVAKRKPQKRKRQQDPDKSSSADRKANAAAAAAAAAGATSAAVPAKEPSSSPQAVKEKKIPKKLAPPVSSPNTKDGKRSKRPVLESSDEEDSDEDVRVRKKPMRERRPSMVSKSSTNEPSSPAISRQSSSSKIVKREESKSSKDGNSKPPSRKPSSEKRHSTDSKIDDKSSAKEAPPAKASTPEAVREARKVEEEARAAKAAEKAAEAERKKREAEEAAAKEALRKAEEERLAREKEEQERREKEERERKEKAEREEHERRVAALPTALRVAVQKGKNRPLHFRPATKDQPGEELGIGYHFLPIQTAPLRNIDPTCPDTQRDETWMFAFQAVGILGLPSELRMTEFPTWERRPVTDEQRDFFLDSYQLDKLSHEYSWPLPGEEGYDQDAITRATVETREKFVKMEPLQWVRFADFEAALKLEEYGHLSGLKLKTTTCRVKEEPDSAVEFSFLFDDDETPVEEANVEVAAGEKQQEEEEEEGETGKSTVPAEEAT